jgi:dihydrofolate reductase
MEFILIVALSLNNVIGLLNKIPWYVPEDLIHFKEKTINNVIIMGRKTFESLGTKAPLPNRMNIVITTNPDKYISTENLIFIDVNGIDDIIKNYKSKIFIIGGSEIYRLFLDKTTEILITEIQQNYTGDVYFNRESLTNDFKISEVSTINKSRTGIEYRFIKMVRK